jgi:hypothetical protein
LVSSYDLADRPESHSDALSRGSSQTETRRPDHELVDTVEASDDLADRPESHSDALSRGSSPTRPRHYDYEVVDTVEASYDLADQLQSLCPRLCRPLGRQWRPRGGRKARQRMAIRKGARKSTNTCCLYYFCLFRLDRPLK